MGRGPEHDIMAIFSPVGPGVADKFCPASEEEYIHQATTGEPSEESHSDSTRCFFTTLSPEERYYSDNLLCKEEK
ncbi:hypothetical protein NHX12_033670 [Muraenolepis orangiensis]|uniref:Uncharacterized protein n=1 Tax=Muraenolepis orangiensis TaxID=630683 RepID=A0A9Q0E451_9TELE|nr:hypothetical protein NHX12_033670 [Muraenolepis orangiensis]